MLSGESMKSTNWMVYFTIHLQNSRLRSRHNCLGSLDTVHIFPSFWSASSDLYFLTLYILYMLSILIVLILLKWDHMPLFPNCNGYKWFPTSSTTPLCSPKFGQNNHQPKSKNTASSLKRSEYPPLPWTSYGFINQSEWRPGHLFDCEQKRTSFFLWMMGH